MKKPIFLTQIATASLPKGIAIRLDTVDHTGRTGPVIEFLASAEAATQLAHSILEAMEDWHRENPNLLENLSSDETMQ